MAIKDILLPLVGEPNAAAIAAIDKCMAVAGDFGARVTAMAVEEDILVRPKVTISSDLENAAEAAAVRSVSDARGLLKAFDAAANRFGVRNEQRLNRLDVGGYSGEFRGVCAARGFVDGSGQTGWWPIGEDRRTADIRIRPADPDVSGGTCRRVGRRIRSCHDRVGSYRAGRRAVADALPTASGRPPNVRVVTATDDKTPAELESGAALVSHLAEHGIKATFEAIKNRRQLGRKGVRGLCEGQCNRPSGHGGVPPLPAERNRVGRRDQDRHRAATLLGYDVALGRRSGRATCATALSILQTQAGASRTDRTDVNLSSEKSACAPLARAGRGKPAPGLRRGLRSPEYSQREIQGRIWPGEYALCRDRWRCHGRQPRANCRSCPNSW